MKKFWKNPRKVCGKVFVYSVVFGSAFLAEACGSNNSASTSPIVADTTAAPACTVVVGNESVPCGSQTTGSQIYSACGTHYISATDGTQVCPVTYTNKYNPNDYQAVAMGIDASGNVSGGQGILAIYAGDQLSITAQGHYEDSTGYNCDDISVLGNWDGNTPLDSVNGKEEGLYTAFVDSSGNYSSLTAVTSQNQSQTNQQLPVVPTTFAGAGQLTVGYNANSSIVCGDMQISYTLKRCIDSSGAVHPCSF